MANSLQRSADPVIAPVRMLTLLCCVRSASHAGAAARRLGLCEHGDRVRRRRTAELCGAVAGCGDEKSERYARTHPTLASLRCRTDRSGGLRIAGHAAPARPASPGGWGGCRAPSSFKAALTARSNSGTGSTTSETWPAVIS